MISAGTIAASMLAFILPSIFYFKTFEKELYSAWIELCYNKIIPTEDTTVKTDDTLRESEPTKSEPTSDVSEKSLLSKLYNFEQFRIPTLMLAFGIVSLIAGLQSIFG